MKKHLCLHFEHFAPIPSLLPIFSYISPPITIMQPNPINPCVTKTMNLPCGHFVLHPPPPPLKRGATMYYNTTTLSVIESAMLQLQEWLTSPYLWGGDDPLAGFDCSGLAGEYLKSIGLIPRGQRMTAQGLLSYFVRQLPHNPMLWIRTKEEAKNSSSGLPIPAPRAPSWKEWIKNIQIKYEEILRSENVTCEELYGKPHEYPLPNKEGNQISVCIPTPYPNSEILPGENKPNSPYPPSPPPPPPPGWPPHGLTPPLRGAIVWFRWEDGWDPDAMQDKLVGHVEVAWNGYQSVGASGGGSTTTSLQDAIARNAYVQLRPIIWERVVACLWCHGLVDLRVLQG